MRTFVVLICSLSLAFFNASGQQEPQGAKGKKKAAPTQQGARQGAKPAGKPAQTGRPAVPPAKPAEYGKPKGGAYPAQANKPAQYGKPKGRPQGQPQAANANKREYGKPKGQGQAANANKAEYGKPKGQGQAATFGQPGGPNPPKVGKPGKAGVAAGKPFKPQHINVPKQPNIAKAPPVKFQQGKHIQGAEHWQGQQYAAFRNYHSEWHDQGWWHSHYHNNFVFVFGAPYYWNAGYWFPAWGYAPNAYYAWDGPIYAYNHLPPDQVIANVQTALQQQGYYQGEVDGSIGPLTRAALADYQRANGLTETAAIDQPTLESLGMS